MSPQSTYSTNITDCTNFTDNTKIIKNFSCHHNQPTAPIPTLPATSRINGLKHLDDPTVYRNLKRDTTPIFNFTTKSWLSWKHWDGKAGYHPNLLISVPHQKTTQPLSQKNPQKSYGYQTYSSIVNSVTENISRFVDGWLNPLVQKLPSLKIRWNSSKLVITTLIPTNSILVSIDAVPPSIWICRYFSEYFDHKYWKNFNNITENWENSIHSSGPWPSTHQ